MRQVVLTCLVSSIAIGGLALPRVSYADDSSSSANTTVSIPLNDDQLPASDLMYTQNGQTRMLAPDEAWQLKQSGVDLSKLEPDGTTDVFVGTPAQTKVFYDGPGNTVLQNGLATDNALPIQDGDTVSLAGVIQSSTGLFRLNVQTQPASGAPETLTLMLTPNVHTYLLRKELLRRLGYRIPAMKWIKRVSIKFSNIIDESSFLMSQMPDATLVASTRWCRVSPAAYQDMVASAAKGKLPPCLPDATITNNDPLTLVFQDVIAMDATPLYYNVAIGPPIQQIPGSTQVRAEGPRILRALAIPYSLANVPESVNQVDWYDGSSENNSILLETPDSADFATTDDDALWIARKLATLSRDDFQEIVSDSGFPDPVAKVLVEKLIARRDSLLNVFGLAKLDANASYTQKIGFDSSINDLPYLKDGKIVQQVTDDSCQADIQLTQGTAQDCTWAGYASRFAWGDPDSPLQGLGWFALSEAESNVIQNGLDYINNAMPQLNMQTDIANHTQQALTKYLQTGVNQLEHFGAWVGPVVNGNFPSVSRDVVFGDYLGTNNLVQLVDTFTLSATAGIMIGFDGMPATPAIETSLQGIAEGQFSLSLTHVKPLTSLKQAVTEKIQNEFVPWIFYNAAKVLDSVSSAQPQSPVQNMAALKTQLSNEMDQLKSFMGVGDSLILTESINGTEGLTAAVQAPVAASPTISVTPGLTQIVISRLQFYRSDENTIQVFKDNGELNGLTLAFTLGVGPTGSQAQFPVISVNAEAVAGSAQTKAYSLNINPDPTQNGQLFATAAALSSALKTSSIDVLAHMQKPNQVQIKFDDSTSSMNFFHWMRRSLKSKGAITATLQDGTSENVLDLTDGAQTGDHYQNLATQAATFLTQYLTNNPNYSVNTQANVNPGQSFLGNSQTRDLELQGKVDTTARNSGGLTDALMRYHYRWEGWSMSAQDLVSLTNGLSSKYGFTLYPSGFSGDTQDFKMYEISLYIDIYEAGLQKLLLISNADFNALNDRYYKANHCDRFDESDITHLTSRELDTCAGLEDFVSYIDKYRNHLRKYLQDGGSAQPPSNLPPKLASDMLQAANAIEKAVSFQDLVNLVGGQQNIFVYSNVDGFREGSEILSNPINSSTFGTCQDPDGQSCNVSSPQPSGIVDELQSILGIQDGEFKAQWLRTVL